MPASGSTSAQTDQNETRAALIAAGERLFAEQGIGGPSIRELIAAAGVGNKSALQYHFGTRDGLVSAIVAGHGETLRARRALAFEPVVLDDASNSIERLCEVVVGPYCEFLSDGPGQLRYLIISAEVLSDPTRRYEDLQVLFNDSLLPRIVALMLEQLDLPDVLATERLIVGISQVIAAVSTRARQQLFGEGVRGLTPPRLFVTNLIDMLQGAVAAPVSSATRSALAATTDTHRSRS